MEDLEIKKYKIYKYNEAFYTKEELEEIGFKHFCLDDFRKKHENGDFEIFFNFGENEAPLDYTKVLEDENNYFDDCFVIDGCNCVRVLPVDKYFVLELDGANCVCEDIDDCNRVIEEMQESCKKVLLRNGRIDQNSKDYKKQKQLQKSKNDLKGMFSSK